MLTKSTYIQRRPPLQKALPNSIAHDTPHHLHVPTIGTDQSVDLACNVRRHRFLAQCILTASMACKIQQAVWQSLPKRVNNRSGLALQVRLHKNALSVHAKSAGADITCFIPPDLTGHLSLLGRRLFLPPDIQVDYPCYSQCAVPYVIVLSGNACGSACLQWENILSSGFVLLATVTLLMSMMTKVAYTCT